MTDGIRELQKDAVLSRAQALDLDDARRTPYCQAGLSKCHNTLHCNAPTQRKQFATREEWQTAVLRSLGVPVSLLRDTGTVDCGRATNQVHRPKVETETEFSTEV